MTNFATLATLAILAKGWVAAMRATGVHDQSRHEPPGPGPSPVVPILYSATEAQAHMAEAAPWTTEVGVTVAPAVTVTIDPPCIELTPEQIEIMRDALSSVEWSTWVHGTRQTFPPTGRNGPVPAAAAPAVSLATGRKIRL